MTDLLAQLPFWQGVGRLIVDVLLVSFMWFTVMAISGNPVRPPRRRTPTARTTPAAGDEQTEAAATEPIAPTPKSRADADHIAHLNLLATLRNTLKLQGATVVLIVFAVLILGFNRVIDGAEVATILAGISGYVLGTHRAASEPSGQPPAPTNPPPGDGQT